MYTHLFMYWYVLRILAMESHVLKSLPQADQAFGRNRGNLPLAINHGAQRLAAAVSQGGLVGEQPTLLQRITEVREILLRRGARQQQLSKRRWRILVLS